MLLTLENYKNGFLIDEELMGGVTEHPERPGFFVAFILRHTTGEYLGCQPFHNLSEAITTLNGVKRPWSYEKTSSCGNGKCGKSGGCSAGRCNR